MRILFVTNFYPPYELGGQGLSCQEVVEGLKQRGHQTVVLTSIHGTNHVAVEANGIYRLLYLEMDFIPWRQSLYFFTRRKYQEKQNWSCFERVFEQFEPDIVFIWGMWNFPYSLPFMIETRCPGKVVYRFGDYWPTLPSQHENYWRAPGRNWAARVFKRMLSPIALAMLARDKEYPSLKFEHTICISIAVRRTLVEAGIPVSGARVVYNGLDIEKYQYGEQKNHQENEKRGLELVYVGRLSPEKGVDSAIKAVTKLIFDHDFKNINLTLVGSGNAKYEDYLHLLVVKNGMSNHFSFLGQVPRGTIPTLLRKFDVLLLPSVWPEPFGRVVLEGMASGLVVIATPTGGPGEVIRDGENGLLFAPNDVDALVDKIKLLVGNPELYNELVEAGRETVLERFTQTRMIDDIEQYLQEVINLPHIKTNL